jgi:carboxyl-terminal processing protease
MQRLAFRPVLAAVLVASAAWFGGRHGETLGRWGRVAGSAETADQTARFRSVLNVVAGSLAEAPDLEDAVFKGAIPGMLARLDPHSQFYDPEQFERLREEQQGSYAGVGMQIREFRGDTIVDFPFPATPAFRAGVKPGDVIVAIDGISTKDYGVDEVARDVRGPRGTTVRLGLERTGNRRLEIDLLRDNPRPTIPLAFELRPAIAYLKITSFGETTADELDAALADFQSRPLRGLVLDLRDNHGGLLTAGVHVAGRFLPDGASVVSHRGAHSAERRYDAQFGDGGETYPMTVLVNCRSASASEIVAGALQDHDRALVVGTNTFGKGLVQSVYPTPANTAVVLTTARYYTPSGRLIQRDYDGVAAEDYYGDPCSADFEPDRSDARITDGGRTVYGGGGVAPDVSVRPGSDGPFLRQLAEARSFERFAQTLPLESFDREWRPNAAAVSAFLSFAALDGIAAEPEVLEREMPEIRRRLRTHVFIAAFDVDAGARVDAESDPQVLAAASNLSLAAALLEQAKPGAVARNTTGERPALVP